MLPPLLLVILGGLLAQNALGTASPQAIVTLGSEQLQYLISARLERQDIRGQLQNLPLQDTLTNSMRQQDTGGLLPILTGLVDNVLGNILGLRIRNVELLKLDIRFDEMRNHIFVTIPADLELEIHLPLHLGRLLHVKLFLDVQVGVQLLRNPIDNSVHLVVGNCYNNPGHLRVTLLNNKQHLFQAVNNLMRTVTDVLEKTVPHLLQKELCPLVNSAIQSVLQLLQGSLSSDVHGRTIQLSPMSHVLQNGAMELSYQGVIRLPGGEHLLIPPGPYPLPHAPLDGSPMNIVLSGNLLNAELRALVPPQAINIVNPQEVAVFSQAEVLRSLAPTASHIRTLQIAHGDPSLTLTVGSIQAQQVIEVKAYGDHPRGTAQLFAIGARVHLNVGISAVGGKLTITFTLGRIDNVSVISSSAQQYHANPKVQSLIEPITQLVSSSLLPRQNQRLSEGFPIPMARELGVVSFSVASGQDALKLSVPTTSLPGQLPVVV